MTFNFQAIQTKIIYCNDVIVLLTATKAKVQLQAQVIGTQIRINKLQKDKEELHNTILKKNEKLDQAKIGMYCDVVLLMKVVKPKAGAQSRDTTRLASGVKGAGQLTKGPKSSETKFSILHLTLIWMTWGRCEKKISQKRKGGRVEKEARAAHHGHCFNK